MARLIARKFILMLFFLPLLNFIGYTYAQVHPRLFSSPLGNAASASSEPYSAYIQGVLFDGNLGQVDRLSVSQILSGPVQNSLVLVGFALLVSIVLGLLIGLLSVSPRTKRMSTSGLFVLAAGSSMPGFLLGGVLLAGMVYLVFFTEATSTFLPISGYGLDEHLILPVLVLAIQPTLHLAKVVAGLLENELQKDYIQVARSKGLSWRQLLWSHALPNMISPILVTIGESVRLMVGALVIIEAVFIWPGIGRIFLFTIGLRLDARPPGVYFGNPPLLAAIAVVLGAILLLSDLLFSLLANVFDPRLSQAEDELETAVA
ncbi:MAG: glutathione ABC transporter permease [Ardenticatenaceae bacterium]|nr:MAG: glutathione ABC transporter permease [Ardenticatenaceae bacterium]